MSRDKAKEMFGTLKYNFDVEDWAVATTALLRAQGKDPKLLIHRDLDGHWCIGGLQVDGKVMLAPDAVISAWMQRIRGCRKVKVEK